MDLRVALFTAGTGIIPRLIQWQTDSYYWHAGLLFNDLWLIEANTSDGVVERKLTDYRGVELYTVENITQEDIARIYEFAWVQIGKGYDYWGVLRFISRRLLPENDRWFCSELVYAAFQAAEIHLLERVEAWQVSPGLLARSPRLHRVS